MDSITTIVISGLAFPLVVISIAYIFKIKQLYLLVPRLFGYSGLTSGKLIEMQAVNRGRSIEEEVHIDMPPNLTYELLASDHTDVKLEKNKVILSRMSPMSDISLILLAEGSIDGDTFIPSITSKTSKGKVLKNSQNIPPNYGSFLIIVCIVVLLATLMLVGPKKYSEYQQQVVLKNYAYLTDDGWTGFEIFLHTDYAQSYSKKEFPLAFTGVKKVGENTYELNFIATNKTTLPLSIDTLFDNEDEFFFSTLKGIKNASTVTVNPLNSSPVTISFKLDNSRKLSDVYINFVLRFGDYGILGVVFYPSKNNEIMDLIKHTRID